MKAIPSALLVFGVWAASECRVLAASETERFFYDAVGRLSGVVVTEARTTSLESFRYDVAGNRVGWAIHRSGVNPADASNDAMLTTRIEEGIDPFLTDSDGDGANDYEEWVAGTGIGDKADALVLREVDSLGSDRLRFETPVRRGRVYEIQYCEQLGLPWETLGSPFKATADGDQVFEIVVPSTGYFRLQVRREE